VLNKAQIMSSVLMCVLRHSLWTWVVGLRKFGLLLCHGRPSQQLLHCLVAVPWNCIMKLLTHAYLAPCRLIAGVATNSQTKPANVGCESADINDCYHPPPPSPFVIFTIPHRAEGWVDLGTAGKVRSPCLRLYITVALMINATACGLSRCSQSYCH